MSERPVASVRPQPMIAVVDVDVGHHHGTIGDPTQLTGNGVAIWFEVDDFDAVVRRIRDADAQVVTDVHLNPNAGHREIWIRDLDGYLVVLAEARGH